MAARTVIGSPWTFGNTGGATSIALPARTLTAGSLVVATFRWESSDSFTGVTDSAGATWQFVDLHNGNVGAAIAWSWNHPGGTNVVITASFSASVSFRYAGGIEFSGGDSSDPFQSGATVTSTTAPLDHTVTFTAPGLIVSTQSNYNNSSYTIVTGTNITTGSYICSSYILNQTTSPGNPEHTGGSGTTANISLAFSEAGGGATNYTLTCDTGAYTLTGVAATTSRGVRMTGDVGAYSLTGQAATTSRGYSLAGDVGAYSLTGEAAGTQAGFRIGADTGAYSLTGQDATLTYSQGTTNYTLTAETGNYTLTGVNAGTVAGRRLVADVGAYSLTGESATTSKGTRLVADVGAYTLTGQDATLTATATVNYTLACETGDYSLSGVAAGLEYTDGSAPTRTAGFVITDTAPRLWWQRKPKALDEEEAEQLVERVVRVVERIARAQVQQPKPAPAKERKAEVRDAIAPLVEQMPGFDWMAVYRAILIELERRKQEEQARELAAAEIARIRAIEQDDEDVLLLLMSV